MSRPEVIQTLIARRSDLENQIATLCAWHPVYDEPESPRGWLTTLSQRDIEIESRICGAGKLYGEYLTLGEELHRRLRIRLIRG